MRCSDLDELLSAYANGELSRTQREFIEEHLSSCADCRVALADYTEVRQQLMYLKATPSMPDLSEATMSRIRAAKYAPLKADGRKGIGSFIPNRLNWKTGLISILALVLVVSLAVTIPSLFGQGDKALAAEIAKNSSEVVAALEGEEISAVEVIEIKDDIATVTVEGTLGGIVTVKVDLLRKIVSQVISGQLTDEEIAEIIDILKADPVIRGILDEGAVIASLSVYKIVMPVVKEGEGPAEPLEKRVQVTIYLGDKGYEAEVDVIGEQIFWFGEIGSPEYHQRHSQP